MYLSQLRAKYNGYSAESFNNYFGKDVSIFLLTGNGLSPAFGYDKEAKKSTKEVVGRYLETYFKGFGVQRVKLPKDFNIDGIKDLMEKTVEAETKKQAEKQGIPVDVLKRINTLEDKVKQQDIERENIIRSQKEKDINYVLDDFVQNHSLNQKAINKMANDLLSDGFNLNVLMNMPRSAVNRILNSYLPKETVSQDILAKKEQIKKEVPPTGNSSSGSNVDDKIDEIAKKWLEGVNY